MDLVQRLYRGVFWVHRRTALNVQHYQQNMATGKARTVVINMDTYAKSNNILHTVHDTISTQELIHQAWRYLFFVFYFNGVFFSLGYCAASSNTGKKECIKHSNRFQCTENGNICFVFALTTSICSTGYGNNFYILSIADYIFSLIKTQLSNLVRTMRFWNNPHQKRSKPNYLKAK